MVKIYSLILIIILLSIIACDLPKYSLDLRNDFNELSLSEDGNIIYAENSSSEIIIEIEYSVNNYTEILNKAIVPEERIELYNIRNLYEYGYVEIIFSIDNITTY